MTHKGCNMSLYLFICYNEDSYYLATIMRTTWLFFTSGLM